MHLSDYFCINLHTKQRGGGCDKFLAGRCFQVQSITKLLLTCI